MTAPDAGNEQAAFRAKNLENGLLSHQVADHVRALIRGGQLKDGSRLPSERELSEQLGVSRSIVREAINLLKASGIVRSKAGVGSFVAAPSVNILEVPLSYLAQTDAQKIRDLQQAREVIEPAIADLAAQAARPEDLALMNDTLTQMRQGLGDPARYMQLDNAFHLALTQAAHNSIFTLGMQSIIDLLKEGMWLAVHAPGAIETSLEFHERLLAALQAKDSPLARQIMLDHMRQSTQAMQTLLEG